MRIKPAAFGVFIDQLPSNIWMLTQSGIRLMRWIIVQKQHRFCSSCSDSESRLAPASHPPPPPPQTLEFIIQCPQILLLLTEHHQTTKKKDLWCITLLSKVEVWRSGAADTPVVVTRRRQKSENEEKSRSNIPHLPCEIGFRTWTDKHELNAPFNYD